MFSLVLITPLLNILSNAGWIMMFSGMMVETGITTSLCECKNLPPQPFGKAFPQTRGVYSCSCTAQPSVEHTQETSTALRCSLPAAALSGVLPSKLQPPWCLQIFSFGSSVWGFPSSCYRLEFLTRQKSRLLSDFSLCFSGITASCFNVLKTIVLYIYFSVVCVCRFRWFCRSCSWDSILDGSGSPIFYSFFFFFLINFSFTRGLSILSVFSNNPHLSFSNLLIIVYS